VWLDQSMVKGVTLCVKINNILEKYFDTYKGVKHGNPFSPLLFNVVGGGVG
jgi:hypothetical protein